MDSTRGNQRRTAQQSLHVSAGTRLRLILAAIGSVGIVLFGYLMDQSLAPVREAPSSFSDRDFTSFGEMIIIPGFLLSGLLFVYAVNELYKTYRTINDPNTYHGKTRRNRRTPLH